MKTLSTALVLALALLAYSLVSFCQEVGKDQPAQGPQIQQGIPVAPPAKAEAERKAKEKKQFEREQQFLQYQEDKQDPKRTTLLV